MTHCTMTRRAWLSGVGAATAGTMLRPLAARADGLPTAPVAVARCASYDSEVVAALAVMFDQLGGLEGLVKGKTVAVKINLVGDPWMQLPGMPPELTHWTNPVVIGATVHLLGRAGARRIRILECGGPVGDPLEQWMQYAGWNPDDIRSAAADVEFVNTNGNGSADSYTQIVCPAGHIFHGFEVDRAYTDCDVFVSIPKMKEHHWFGATLSMKNCYGMTPLTIYGDAAGVEEPGTEALGTRVGILHNGNRAPSLSAPQEIDPDSPRAGDYRLPRIIADVVSARPVHLAVIDGIQTIAGGEGPWYENVRPVSPGVLLAGLNPVTTDAVALSVMGFDPAAERGTAPFEGSDSFLTFAQELGLGTRDLNRIEVLGTPVADARFDIRVAGTPAP
jgi:uncharacterized protein (DUF362 family)